MVNDFHNNITDLDEVRLNKLLENHNGLREFEDRYEYCIIKEYEERYDMENCDSIQIDNVFAQILQINNGKRILVSIDFSKEVFTKRDLVLWLDKYEIIFVDDDDIDFIHDANSIIEALKFNSKPIILYEKGKNKIYFNRKNIVEITEAYLSNKQEIDTNKSKDVSSLHEDTKIIYNGEKTNIVPRIEFDLSRGDIIISNGHVIVADYIDDYCGCVGFYSRQDSSLPIAWLHDSDTTIYIDVYEREKQKIAVVEAKYIIDIEDLFYVE